MRHRIRRFAVASLVAGLGILLAVLAHCGYQARSRTASTRHGLEGGEAGHAVARDNPRRSESPTDAGTAGPHEVNAVHSPPALHLKAELTPWKDGSGRASVYVSLAPEVDAERVTCRFHVEADMEVLDDTGRLERATVRRGERYGFVVQLGAPADNIRRSVRIVCHSDDGLYDRSPRYDEVAMLVMNPRGRYRSWTACEKDAICEGRPMSFISSARPAPGKTVDLEFTLLGPLRSGTTVLMTIEVPPGTVLLDGSLDSGVIDGDGVAIPALRARVTLPADAAGKLKATALVRPGWGENVSIPIEEAEQPPGGP